MNLAQSHNNNVFKNLSVEIFKQLVNIKTTSTSNEFKKTMNHKNINVEVLSTFEPLVLLQKYYHEHIILMSDIRKKIHIAINRLSSGE